MVISLRRSILRFGIRFHSSISREGKPPRIRTPKLMNAEIAKDIIVKVDNFIFDCDGVLWDGRGPISGSLETVNKLKERGKNIFYVTNNSSKNREGYVEKCQEFGFPAEQSDIICPAYLVADYLKKLNFTAKVYLIAKEESVGYELRQQGVEYIGTGPDLIEGMIQQWLSMPLDPEVKCVLVASDPHISYMKIMKAASYLKNPDCLFLATNPDTTYPSTGHICVPGTGCMISPIALAANRQPIVLGKPETNMFEVLKSEHNLDPSRCLMIGDRIDTDIMFAENCGLRSFLVLSGVCGEEIITNPKEGDSMPDFYGHSLGHLGQFL